jgi:hypothetical protein
MNVTGIAIVLPVFAQVVLTFVVLLMMGQARAAAAKDRGKGRGHEMAMGTYDFGEEATKRANNFSNQFEVPVLFYAAAAFALLTRTADGLMVSLAWAFVALRLVHAAIHIGPNRVQPRALVYFLGVLVVMAMWVLIVLRAGVGA